MTVLLLVTGVEGVRAWEIDQPAAQRVYDALRREEGRARARDSIEPAFIALREAVDGRRRSPTVAGPTSPSTAGDRDRDGLLTIEDVMAALRCGATTAKRLISSGELVSLLIGRRRFVRLEDLETFIESRRGV